MAKTIDSAHSSPIVGALTLAPGERQRLRERFQAGALDEADFTAIVFKDGPNSNHFRFRQEDLAAFAASFTGQPFLRNHDTAHIEARDGTITDAVLSSDAFEQTITLTTQRGIQSFLEGQIDRFSIGWYFDSITCSICNTNWFDCFHWPGQTYTVDKKPVTCELIFENPRGKETSAVNAPAVEGTGILAQLCERKTKIMKEKKQHKEELRASTTPGAETTQETHNFTVVNTAASTPTVSITQEETPQPSAEPNEWVQLARKTAIEAAVSASGLPAPMKTVLLERFGEDENATPAQVEQAIAEQKKVWASLQEDAVINGLGQPRAGGLGSQMKTPLDQMQSIIDWMFGVEGAPTPEPQMRSIANVYQYITGDYNWYGVFKPEQAQLANAETGTLTGLATDSLNKVIIEIYNGLQWYRWFEPLAAVQPNDGSLHSMDWIQFGGVSNLDTVTEGGAYTEKTVADSKETDSFTKYGNYVGLTLEMIRKSRLAQMRAIPRQLAIAAVRTRSAAIAGIFSSNSGVGPTLDQDSTALFHSNHSNLATTALSWSAWSAARLECFKQTELGSSKRQGLFPRFCLVPADLYDSALVIFGYGQGPGGKPGEGSTTSFQDVNPFADTRNGDPRPVPIAVPDWTDANDWAYLADPRIAPVIQMSYAQAPGGSSHPAPELFSVASPTSGLMFTNDTMPIKVRDWFAYGVATYRGIGKRNVT